MTSLKRSLLIPLALLAFAPLARADAPNGIVSFTFTPADAQVRGSARFSGLGSGRSLSDVATSIPASSDGTWTLQLNIVPLSRLVGSAQIILPNGRILQAR